MDGENGASFTMEGETIACTRINKKLDRKKLIRAWKSTEKEGRLLAHHVVILKANGKRLSKSLKINEGDKTYCTYVREN